MVRFSMLTIPFQQSCQMKAMEMEMKSMIEKNNELTQIVKSYQAIILKISKTYCLSQS